MFNPLSDNPSMRRRIYSIFWLIGVLLGAIQIAFATMSEADQPWLQAAFAVYAFLGGAVGYQAAANTPENGEEIGDAEMADLDLDVDELDEDMLEDLPDNDDDLL